MRRIEKDGKDRVLCCLGTAVMLEALVCMILRWAVWIVRETVSEFDVEGDFGKTSSSQGS